MSYRKQISYLELQENGQRIGSAGYARLESLDREEILTVQWKGQGITPGKAVSLYLQRESGEQMLCEMTADRGRGSCEERIPGKEDREPIVGIRIPLDRGLEIIGRFAGAGGMKKAPVPATASAAAPETVGEIEGQEQSRKQPEQKKRPEQTEQPITVFQNEKLQREQVPKENQGAQEQSRQPRNQPAKAAETVVAAGNMDSGSGVQNPGEFQNDRDAYRPGSAADAREPQPSKKAATEPALHMKDTKWEQLSSIYPHIHPFRDTREFLSVGPEDFVVLRERCYQMTHNSFLLHGYYNYRHLLLMRQDTPEQVKYYIGVPGNFYEREKQVARMFGFESFEGTREPAWEGDFGYYLISVEL